MKAIKTTYVSATSTKPSRIRASAEGVKSKFYTPDDGHEVVARDFARCNNWPTDLASGQLPNGDWVHCFIPERQPTVAFTDEQKVKAYLDYTNNFLTVEKFADHYGITFGRAFAIITSGRELHEASCKPRIFTVVSVSSNANSFGYKGALVITEDGTGFECLYSFGNEPKRGDKIEEAKLPTYCRRELPKAKPENAVKVIKGIPTN